LQVSSKDGFEIHDNLAFAPAHSRYVVDRVNEASRIVTLDDLKSETPAPFNQPTVDLEVALAGGHDGSGGLAAADFLGWDRGPGNRAGLMAFEDVEDLGLLCAPDLCAPAPVVAAPGDTRHERDGDRMSRKVEAPAKLLMTPEDIQAVQQAMIDFCERKK